MNCFFVALAAVLSAMLRVNAYTCTPGERTPCHEKGYCNDSGDNCICYDYHNWPSERCEFYHEEGRELPDESYWCYPDEIDEYCSWLGRCSSDGMYCDCFEQPHRYSWDRCKTWMHVPTGSPTSEGSEIPTCFPTSSPTSSPSIRPTTSPSSLPSGNPSELPTSIPSSSPSTNPSAEPTYTPTVNPSATPSVTPTESPTSRPTNFPTPNPTHCPTLRPTFDFETNRPTLSPTIAPTPSPTHPGDTNSPSASPTEVPSASPSTPPPTVSPTVSPTPAPTRPGDTNAPSLEPTAVPSISGTPRIVAAYVPLESVHRDNFTVIAEVELSGRFVGGSVYCGVTTSVNEGGISSVLPSVEAVRQQGHKSSLPSALIAMTAALSSMTHTVSVDIATLTPLTEYNVFCFAEDSLGNHRPLDPDLFAAPVTTQCCHEVSFTGSPPRVILSDASMYVGLSEAERDVYTVKFKLSSLPSSLLSVHLRIVGNSSVVKTQPSSVQFTPQSVGVGGSFLLSSTSSGTFQVYLSSHGPSAGDFSSDQTPLSLSVFTNATVLPPPQLSTVYLDNSGSVMYITFDSPTDQAVSVVDDAGAPWPCSLVFSFDGAESASCLWQSTSTVKVVLNSVSASPGSNTSTEHAGLGTVVSLVPGVVKAHCVFGACEDYEFANTTMGVGVVIDPDVSITEAVPVLVAPEAVYSCHNVTLDGSQSQGQAGRPWAVVDWVVSLADPGQSNSVNDASVDAISSYLSSLDKEAVGGPITVPSNLFEPTDYFISLGLRNFLQSETEPLQYSVVKVSVLSGSDVLLSLTPSGSRHVSLARTASNAVHLSARAEVSSCSEAAAAAALASLTLRYVWVVFDGNGTQLAGEKFASVSSDPASYVADSMVFDVGVTYEVRVTAIGESIDGSEPPLQSNPVYFSVHISLGDLVVGNINGVNSLLVRAGAALVLDTREAVDLSRREDDPVGELSAEWSCKVVSSDDYGTNCFETWGLVGSASLQARELSIPAGNLFAGYEYEISVRLSSDAYGAHRSATSSIHIETSLNNIRAFDGSYAPIRVSTAMTGKSNVNARVIVDASISCSNLIGPVHAAWSLVSYQSSRALDMNNISVAAWQRDFSVSQLTTASGISFPVGLAKDSLTPGSSYALRLSLSTIGAGDVELQSYVEISIECNDLPRGGGFSVTPTIGMSFSTDFTMLANHWTDDVADYPLQYHFKYQTLGSYHKDLPTKKASVLSTVQHTITTLPAGRDVDGNVLTAIVDVVDTWGGAATATVPVEVRSMFVGGSGSGSGSGRRLTALNGADMALITEELLPSSVAMLSTALTLHDGAGFQKAAQKSLNFLEALRAADCSLAPDCAELHRLPCSSVSHTCGACEEGHVGVLGSANWLCVDASTGGLLLPGSACSTNSSCSSGICSDSVCVMPVKSCPLGQENGEECSGRSQGQCSYLNYQNEPLLQEHCTVDNPYCRSVCSCLPGFSGSDCSMLESNGDLTTRDQFRRDICSSLYNFTGLLGSSPTDLETFADFIGEIIFVEEILTRESMEVCGRALGMLGAMLDSSPSLLGLSSVSTPQRIVDSLSEVVRSDFSPHIEAEIYDVLNAFGRGWQHDMVAGELVSGVAADNLRISFSYPILTSLEGMTLEAFHTAADDHYNRDMPHLKLPTFDALALCPGFKNYALFAAVQWGSNPSGVVRSESTVRTSQFNAIPIATATADGYNASSGESNVSVAYKLVLQFYSPIVFESTVPECFELDLETGNFDICERCNVTAYTSTSVTFSCVDTMDVLCPAQSELSDTSSSRKRSLQQASTMLRSQTFYAAVEVDEGGGTDVVALGSGSVQQVQSAVGMISFICTFVVLVLFGFIWFKQWDESDRQLFLQKRQHLIEKGQFEFDISAAFDESGEGMSEKVEAKNCFDVLSNSSGKYHCHDSKGIDDSDMDDITFLSPIPESTECSSSPYSNRSNRNPLNSSYSADCDGSVSRGGGDNFSYSAFSDGSNSTCDDFNHEFPLKSRSSLPSFGRAFSTKRSPLGPSSPVSKSSRKRNTASSLNSLKSLGSRSSKRSSQESSVSSSAFDDTSEPFFEVDFHHDGTASTVESETIFTKVSKDATENEGDSAVDIDGGYDIDSDYGSESPSHGAGIEDGEEEPDDFSSYPPSSLLSEHSLRTRIWRAFRRHHRVFRIFTYPSLRRTRVIRFAVAVNDFLWMTFACALVYALFFPSDSSCSSIVSQDLCTSTRHRFAFDSIECEWESANSECLLVVGSPSLRAVMLIVIACVMATIVPRRLVQVMLEKVCAKRPRLEDLGLHSNDFLGELPESWESVAVGLGKNIYELSDKDKGSEFAGAEVVKAEKAKSVDWLKAPNAAAFDSGNLFQYNSWPALTKPYQYGYCDSITVGEEYDLITSTAQDLFQKTLNKMPLPWRERFAVVDICHLKDALDAYSVCDDGDISTSHDCSDGATASSNHSLHRDRVRCFGWMVAVMQHLKVHADGTPEPLTWWQTWRHGSAFNNMCSRIASARSLSKRIQFQATSPSHFAPGQTEYKDIILLQNFVLELLPSMWKFAIKKDLFNLDHASPGSCSALLWFGCWSFLVICWASMTGFILNWAVASGDSPMWSVAEVLSVIIIFETIVNDCCQILLLHVFVTDRLRPQLRDIYKILCAAYHSKLRKGYVPAKHLRVVQHLSASCRAARLRSLSYLSSAGLLSILEDRDFLRCRHRRDMVNIGFLAKAVLFLPSVFNWAYDTVQTGVLDFLIPTFWCSFILVQAIIAERSRAMLGVFWVALVMLAVLYASMARRKHQQVLDMETMQLKVEEAEAGGWNTLLVDVLSRADAGLHVAPEVKGVASFYHYVVFRVKTMLGIPILSSEVIDENWKLLNRIDFRNNDGVLRSSLAKRKDVQANITIGAPPQSIENMMVVTSRAWHEDQRWRLCDWLKNTSDAFSQCVCFNQNTPTSSAPVRSGGAKESCTFVYKQQNSEVESSEVAGMCNVIRDNDECSFSAKHDVKKGYDVIARHDDQSFHMGDDDGSVQTGVFFHRDSRSVDSFVPMDRLQIPNDLLSECSSEQQDADANGSSIVSASKGSSSNGTKNSNKSSRSVKSKKKLPKPRNSINEHSSNCSNPSLLLQNDHIFAAFSEQCLVRSDDNKRLPMDKLVSFASQVLSNSAMLSPEGASNKFECTEDEISEAVEPLRIFVSSPNQSHKSVDYATFMRWLEKSCAEIVEKRHSKELGSDALLPTGRRAPGDKRPAQQGAVSETTRLVERPGGKPEPSSSMIGMELEFDGDDDVSLLSNPLSVGGSEKAAVSTSTPAKQSRVPTRRGGAAARSKVIGVSNEVEQASTGAGSGGNGMKRIKQKTHSSGLSRHSDELSYDSNSSASSGSTVSNPPISSQLNPYVADADYHCFESKRRTPQLEAVEELSHEDSEQSTATPRRLPKHSPTRSPKPPRRIISYDSGNGSHSDSDERDDNAPGFLTEVDSHNNNEFSMGSSTDRIKILAMMRDEESDSSVDTRKGRSNAFLRQHSSLSSDGACDLDVTGFGVMRDSEIYSSADYHDHDDDIPITNLNESDQPKRRKSLSPSVVSVDKADIFTL